MTDLKSYLLEHHTPTYMAYYRGRMSYCFHGDAWRRYVQQHYQDLAAGFTSENIFKDVIDAYAENLVPVVPVLSSFRDAAIPLLIRGEALAILTSDGSLTFPERFEVVSDGNYHMAMVMTRSLREGEDYLTFIDSDGNAELYSMPTPDDLSTSREGYTLVEQTTGHQLYRFAMDTLGMGDSLASLQDRINHSIIDQTVVAEMYARPFWYLLNYQSTPQNPYLTPELQPPHQPLVEQATRSGGGRVFATSSQGPFGQLEPPTIGDMVNYHDSLIRKVTQTSGIPEFYFNPSGGSTVSGRALMILSKRFNNRISRIRESIEPELLRMLRDMGVYADDADAPHLWSVDTDVTQGAIDEHGLALTQMGFPKRYVAEVVAPGVNLDDYADDGYPGGPSVVSSEGA